MSDTPAKCWNCKSNNLKLVIDKLHGDMIYWKCKECGATATSVKRKGRK